MNAMLILKKMYICAHKIDITPSEKQGVKSSTCQEINN